VSDGLVKEATPETGKRVATLEEFCAGHQGFIVRHARPEYENAIVEQRALCNLGEPYDGIAGNCKHDPALLKPELHQARQLMAFYCSADWP
jgi:hypothetical protein